jgi:hypothetical protein
VIHRKEKTNLYKINHMCDHMFDNFVEYILAAASAVCTGAEVLDGFPVAKRVSMWVI